MEISEHIAALVAEGALLAAAAGRVNHAAPVAGAPGWSVGGIVRHVGLVHRWAATAVRTGSRDAAVYPADDGAGLAAADLVGWFRDGHTALVDTLSTADPAVRTFELLPAPSSLAFWARRQTHENGIHRADQVRVRWGGPDPAADSRPRTGPSPAGPASAAPGRAARPPARSRLLYGGTGSVDNLWSGGGQR